MNRRSVDMHEDLREGAKPAAPPADFGPAWAPTAEGILRAALAEILGSAAAQPFAAIHELADILMELERRNGRLAGRGIAMRMGSACLVRVLRSIPPQHELARQELRLMPLGQRIPKGLLALQDPLSHFCGRDVHLERSGDRLLWQLPDCRVCVGRSSADPACFFMLGLLKEALAWIGGGKAFEVLEVACRARGDDACSFMINPAPLEQ